MAIAIVAYLVFTLLNIWGVQQAALFELFVAVVAAAGLILSTCVALPYFSWENFSRNAWPAGWMGAFAAIPYAIWFYLAIEGVANAAEEAVNPQRDVSRGFGGAIMTLVILATCAFFLAVGIGGWEQVVYAPEDLIIGEEGVTVKEGASKLDSPLPLAIQQISGNTSAVYHLVVGVGLLGLVASFNGIILAAGRALFEMGRVGFFLDSVAQHGTHACDYLLTVDMEMEPVAGYEFSNWEKGYGDFHLVPDWETLRSADWLDRTAIVLCNVCNDDEDHTLVDVAPRSLLLNQLAEVRTLGFDVLCASELEYFMFQESYEEAAENSHQKLRPRGWYIEDYHALQGARVEDYNAAIRRHLTRSGVPVESTKGEWGLGQHEINVRYAEAVAMADRHCLIKQCLKEQAETAGMSVTFMAKYSTDQAGNSCHIHMSLARDGENAFHAEATFRHFASGWLQRIPEFMVFLAPNANSYKRYQAESWAPTRMAWNGIGKEAAARVQGSDTRLGDEPVAKSELRARAAESTMLRTRPRIVQTNRMSQGSSGRWHASYHRKINPLGQTLQA